MAGDRAQGRALGPGAVGLHQLRQAAQSGHVPEPVAERLRHLYHRDTIHGVARRELLRTTLLRFAEASVPVIVLKGAALATLVYPVSGVETDAETSICWCIAATSTGSRRYFAACGKRLRAYPASGPQGLLSARRPP